MTFYNEYVYKYRHELLKFETFSCQLLKQSLVYLHSNILYYESLTQIIGIYMKKHIVSDN